MLNYRKLSESEEQRVLIAVCKDNHDTWALTLNKEYEVIELVEPDSSAPHPAIIIKDDDGRERVFRAVRFDFKEGQSICGGCPYDDPESKMCCSHEGCIRAEDRDINNM